MELSAQSFEGLLVILLVGFIIYTLSQKLIKFASFAIGVLVVLELGYMFSLTQLNDIIPLSDFFKYDIVSSVVHFLGNNVVTDAIVKFANWLQQAINNGINTTFNW
jgi:hypothetical protein